MKVFNIKKWFADKREDAEFAMDDFKFHCVEQWYLFLEESMWDAIKAVLFAIGWFIVANYFYSGLIGTILFFGLAAGAVLYILQPILNLIILGLRCLGVKVRYI